MKQEGGRLGGVEFNGHLFADDMRSVRMSDGRDIAFTRQERAVLLELSRRPGRLVLRARLHAVIAGSSAETSTRNVDYLINRLRHKLGDAAREPRFIATQYGEGYIWLPAPETPDTDGAFVVIGRTAGAALSGTGGEALIEAVRQRLAATISTNAASGSRPPFELELAMDAYGGMLDCAAALRHTVTGQVTATRRSRFPMPVDELYLASEIADWALGSIWQHLAGHTLQGESAPADPPLELHLHDIATALWKPADAWRETEAQLRRACLDNPGDPRPAVMWGLGVYARMVQWPPSSMLLVPEQREAFFGELERVILGHLDRLDDTPLLKLGAAKLLWLAGPQHFPMAEKMADEAFLQSTAFAAAYATRGQIMMLVGRTAEAADMLDRAIAMADYGTTFHTYLLTLRCGVFFAAGDRPRLKDALSDLFLANPESRQISVLMLPEDEADLTPQDNAMLAAIPAGQFPLMLEFLYQSSARWYVLPEHQANIMRPLVRHARRLHGSDIIPADISRIFVPAR